MLLPFFFFFGHFSDQKLEAIYALLEAFGNVSTPRNHNASRFTLLFSMDFDSAGLLTGASVQVCVLKLSLIIIFNYSQWVDLLTLTASKTYNVKLLTA